MICVIIDIYIYIDVVKCAYQLKKIMFPEIKSWRHLHNVYIYSILYAFVQTLQWTSIC